MTFLPILPPWLFLPLAAVLLGAAAVLLRKGSAAARWRHAALVLLVVLAAARPGFAGASAPVANTELNVFFVVDVTPSAAAEDYNGNSPRISGMKADIRALAAELAGARFSLITFDSKASVTLPLTADATALDTMTEVLSPKPAYISKGSSISVAKDLLAERLATAQQKHPQRPRLVYYLGDGEQTLATAPESFSASTGLVDGGAVLGYGTTEGGKMREYSFSADAPGPYILDKANGYQPAISSIDEKSLSAVAAELNVPYVHREAPGNITVALEKSAPKASSSPDGLQNKAGAGRIEIYWILALAGFGLAGWELASLSRTRHQLQGTRKDRQPWTLPQ